MKESKWSATHFRALSFLLFIGALSNVSSAAPGDVDLSFDAGSGVNGTVTALAVQPDGKVIIGGSFTTVKGLMRRGIARLNSDGSGDSTFNPGTGIGSGGGVTALVTALALQPDGKVLIAGDFLTVNGVMRPYVARLYGDSARPALSITRSNSVAVVSWPAAFGNFQLEESTNLSLANGWSTVAETRSTNNSFISVTLPATGSRKFFRVKSQ